MRSIVLPVWERGKPGSSGCHPGGAVGEVELRQLRYFIAVAEELHFGRAAARLHMAQSPLSRQIKGLERELRAELLRRTTRSVALTPAGEMLLVRGRRLLEQADQTVRSVREVDRDGSPVRMAFTACAANALLGKVLEAVRRETGGLPVDVRTDVLTPAQVDAIAGDRVDLGFVVRSTVPEPDALAVRTLQVDPLALVAPRTHPLVGRERVGLCDVAAEDFVAFARDSGSAVRAAFERACREAGFRPRIVHEARDTGTLLGLVAAGVGCAVLPWSIRDGAAAGIAVLPLSGAGLVELAMVWRCQEPRRRVRDVVAAVLAHLGPPGRASEAAPAPAAVLDSGPRSGRPRPVPLIAVTRRAAGGRALSTASTTPRS
jgi:DNA-binding transcriptional LysR family regulator